MPSLILTKKRLGTRTSTRCHTSMKNQTKFDCIIWWDLICSNSTSWRSHSRQVPSRLIWEHRPRRLALPLLEWRPKRNQTISLEGAWALRPDPLGSWVEEAQPLRFGHNLICLLCNSSKMLPYLFDILCCKLNTYLAPLTAWHETRQKLLKEILPRFMEKTIWCKNGNKKYKILTSPLCTSVTAWNPACSQWWDATPSPTDFTWLGRRGVRFRSADADRGRRDGSFSSSSSCCRGSRHCRLACGLQSEHQQRSRNLVPGKNSCITLDRHEKI